MCGAIMSNPLSFLLLGAAGFIAMAAFVIIRGFILKERIYKIGGLAFILMAAASASLSFAQPEAFIMPLVVSGGFFIAAALLVFANHSKFFEAGLREATAASTKTDFSKPLTFSDLFMWDGWFKIVKRWGVRKAWLLYVLFCSGAVSLLPLTLWIFNVGPIFLVTALAIVLLIGVVILSIPAFYLQVVRNLESSDDAGSSTPA